MKRINDATYNQLLSTFNDLIEKKTPTSIGSASININDNIYPSTAIAEETKYVIQQQITQRYYRKELKTHRQDGTFKQYYMRYIQGESIYSIAMSIKFSPCMLSRLFLEKQYRWTKSMISNIFKQLTINNDIPAIIQSITFDTNGMEAEELTRIFINIRECIEKDTFCSPFADRIRHSLGVQFEYILLEQLRNWKLVFESEEELRGKGLAKTPDVRLVLPFGIYDSKSSKFHIINWIDSKAMFGDKEAHEVENTSQLQGYVNRYGPGMVIYWFGCLSTLTVDADIYVTYDFPTNITLPGTFEMETDQSNEDDRIQEAKVYSFIRQDYDTLYPSDGIPTTTSISEKNDKINMYKAGT